CFGDGINTYDGSAITVVGGNVYIASTDAFSLLFMFRSDGTTSGTPMAAPLASKAINAHPIFVKGLNGSLIAPDNSGNFWWTTFVQSNNTWTTPVLFGTGFNWGQGLPYGIRHGKEYAAVNVSGILGPSTTYLFYLQPDGRLVGNAISSGPGYAQVWLSPAGISAFHPAVAVASIPNELPP